MNDNIIRISQELKGKVLKSMRMMPSFVKEYPKADLPEVSNDFILAKDLLEKGEFNFTVCGKVKNGKSSLINALIGRELLPVCTDVATSRVFKISHADSDSFYVVYANGDKKEIKADQLGAYGSQAEIDANGQIDAEKTIAYIEVNTKLDFLPKGVSIIDTPGIGSMYPQHTAITKQYLKMADAALFVANPTPLEKIEIDFLKEIVEITPNIMFITTKVDENGIESVEASIAENIKKIKESIGAKLYRDVSMLTMSSTILLDAAKTDDKDSASFNLEISGFKNVKEEMLTTIFLTQGYYRAGVGYNALVNYYQTMLATLQNRLNGVKKSGEEHDALLEEYEKARMILPGYYPLEDAVYNVSRASLLIKGLLTDDPKCISEGLSDKLHQPYRASLIKDYDKLNSLCKTAGALGTYISGAGPTLMAITDKEETYSLLHRYFTENNIDYVLREFKVNNDGLKYTVS